MIEINTDRGKKFGFTSEKFKRMSYLWKKGKYITISMIASNGRGNFKSLVDKILSDGYGVKIPTPLGRMQHIVRKNGYKHTFEHDEVGSHEVWVLEPKVQAS